MGKGMIPQLRARLGSMLTYNAMFYAHFIAWLTFLSQIPLSNIGVDWLMFQAAFALTAVAAYCFHDQFDSQEDAQAQKKNLSLLIGRRNSALLAIAFGTLGLVFGISISWKIALGLVALWVSLMAYSVKPLRLKSNAIGFLLDAWYAHTLPGILVLLLLSKYTSISYWLYGPLLISFTSIGIGDILSHQLTDRLSDKALGLRTFAVLFPNATHWMIRFFDGLAWVSLGVQSWIFLDQVDIILLSNFNLIVTLLSIAFLVLATVAVFSTDRSTAFRLFFPVSSAALLYLTWKTWPVWALLALAHPYNLNAISKAVKRTGVSLFQFSGRALNYFLFFGAKLFGRDLRSKPLYPAGHEPRWIERLKQLFKI
jgi:hypothetical protein